MSEKNGFIIYSNRREPPFCPSVSVCFAICAIQVFTSEVHVCMVKTVACVWSEDVSEGAVCRQQKTGWRQ